MDPPRRSNPEDQRCILGLQDLKLSNKEEDGTEQAQSAATSKTNTLSKSRPVGAIESFVLDSGSQNNRQDYSFYERSNVIASSKFATPKRVETIASTNKRGDINTAAISGSPTRSLDSLSQRSLSYQTDDLYEIPANPGGQFVPPVYENVEYFGEPQTQPPYYHQLYAQGPPPPPGDGYYDTRYSKAQPQVPVSSKVKLANPSVYQNMLCTEPAKKDFKSQQIPDQRFIQQGSLPGPQVANTVSSRSVSQLSMNDKVKLETALPPPPPYIAGHDNPSGDYTIMKSAPPKYPDVTGLANKDSTVGFDKKVVTVPTTAVYASIAPSAQRPKANIATEVQTATLSPKFYHPKPAVVGSNLSKEKLAPINGAYNPKPVMQQAGSRMQIVEDTNGSDYVCMTGGSSMTAVNTTSRDNVSLATESISSRHLMSGSLCSPNQSPAPSPTPSSVSQLSGGSRGSGGRGKSLLPYSITPPRPPGPSEAQRKIEELTRQLEEEMERQDEEGEYFGKFGFKYCSIIRSHTNSQKKQKRRKRCALSSLSNSFLPKYCVV